MVSQPMQAAMLAAGQDVAAEAARRSPRRTGQLASSFSVESTVATVVARGRASRRASGRVTTDAPHAAATEFGHMSGKATGAGGVRSAVPGAHVLGELAATKAARAARGGRRR